MTIITKLKPHDNTPCAPEVPDNFPVGGRTRTLSVVLEILHRFLVLLGGATGGKRPKVAPFSSLRILFARVQPIFPTFQFPNHINSC
jgi:hypothetical protein